MGEAVALAVTDELLGRNTGKSHEGQLLFDLGYLTAFDPSPLSQAAYTEDPEAANREAAMGIMQSLVAQLFSQPSQAAESGRLAQLPAPITPLPRSQHLPTPKVKTKWETFAEKRGIAGKRKRSKQVWDEVAGEWRDRYGYKAANDTMDVPIVEAGPNDQPGEDPFSAAKKAKKARVAKNKQQQLENLKMIDRDHGSAALPATVKLAANLPEHGRGRALSRKGMVQDIRTASRQSGVSTASMGKFDRRLKDEKPEDRQLQAKRRKFLPVTGSSGQEAAAAGKVVTRMLRERAEDIMDGETLARTTEAATRHATGDEPLKRPKTQKKQRGTSKKSASTKNRK